MKLIVLSIVASTLIYANGIKSLPSFQGYRGIVNTPNATVMPEGEFGLVYTNQVDDMTPDSAIDFRDSHNQNNYYLNMGIVTNLDMSFRYTEGEGYLSDRSLGFKYKIPLPFKDIINIAIGIQDIGGGASNFGTSYIVASEEFHNVRGSMGYAYSSEDNSLNGVFGSVEYQPFSWLQLAGEYDTKEWNAVVKSDYSMKIAKQKVDLGLMAKSSLDYNDIYLGVYAKFPFNDKSSLLHFKNTTSFNNTPNIDNLGLSNISKVIKDDTIHFQYENTLYTYNDIDALGMVLGHLSTSEKAKNIVVSVKKANIIQYTVQVNREDYLKYLETGEYIPNLMTFDYTNIEMKGEVDNTDRFRPVFTLSPEFILVDGSEYGNMDYTVALNIGASMRLAKGTMISGRYNVPIAMSDNFDEDGIFDYRNRNKTSANIDQLLLSQFFQNELPLPWMNLVQVGLFDNELAGISWESGISSLNGNHLFLLKLTYLEDNIYNEMDNYSDSDIRAEKLVSYRYYWDEYNSNIKLTAGEFLYGDRGASLSLERYFSDINVRFDIAQTEHDLRGSNTLAKLSITLPFGPSKRYKTDYFDIKGGDLTYERRKTLVKEGERSTAQPHHLKEIDNDFTLENYFMDKGRSHPSYIKENHNRLRNIFFEN